MPLVMSKLLGSNQEALYVLILNIFSRISEGFGKGKCI